MTKTHSFLRVSTFMLLLPLFGLLLWQQVAATQGRVQTSAGATKRGQTPPGNALHSLASCAPTPTVYYVNSAIGNDGNPGTTTAPFQTIAYAASVAVCPWTTVVVEPGSYPETQTITITQSGTATEPIVFAAAIPGTVTVTLNVNIVPLPNPLSVWLITGSYVTIDGFNVTITPAQSDLATGLIQVGQKGSSTVAQSDRIIGNYLHDLDNSVTAQCQGGGAIDAFPDTDGLQVIGNRIANVGQQAQICGPNNNKPNNQMHGMYSGSTHAYIANNIISNVSGYGIQIWPQGNNTMVINNDVSVASTGGIVVGTETGYTADDVLVANNIVRNITGALYCISEIGPTGTHNVYTNNDTYQCPTGGVYYLNNHLQPQNALYVDPLYVTWVSDGSGDYHLQSTSPMIGQGTNANAPFEDYYGDPREGIDIGAVEHTL